MADLSDLENTIVTTIAAALFPGTSYLAGSAASATGVAGSPTVRLYRGWPLANALNVDLAAGTANVSVFPAPGMARSLGRKYFTDWIVTSNNTPTLTAEVSGSSVIFGGTGSASQVAGVAYGSTPFTTATYRLTNTDTPNSVATTLAAKFPGSTVSGNVLTLNTTLPVYADVVADQTSFSELRRMEQVIRIICWCPSPSVRDAVASLVDATFADIRALLLPDGSYTDVPVYKGTHVDDVPQKANEWRRDLVYQFEYATTLTQTVSPALFIGGNLTSFNSNLAQKWGAAPGAYIEPYSTGLDFSNGKNSWAICAV